MKRFIGIVVLALAVAIYAADSDVVPVEAVEDDGAAPTVGFKAFRININ